MTRSTLYDESEDNAPWTMSEKLISDDAPRPAGGSNSGNTVAFDIIRRATDDFASAREIGKGGSCTVYSADLDIGPRNMHRSCAVKVLKTEKLTEREEKWEEKVSDIHV